MFKIGSNILVIALLILSLVFFLAIIQYLDMTASATEAENAIRYSLKSAVREIDTEYFRDTGERKIDAVQARAKFEEKLIQNQGEVSIEEFEVHNTTPYTESYWGTTFFSPGIHAVVSVTIRELFYGEGLTLQLHCDVEID